MRLYNSRAILLIENQTIGVEKICEHLTDKDIRFGMLTKIFDASLDDKDLNYNKIVVYVGLGDSIYIPDTKLLIKKADLLAQKMNCSYIKGHRPQLHFHGEVSVHNGERTSRMFRDSCYEYYVETGKASTVDLTSYNLTVLPRKETNRPASAQTNKRSLTHLPPYHFPLPCLQSLRPPTPLTTVNGLTL